MSGKPRDMKDSEARILVYLSTSDKRLHFVRAISRKLLIDYRYLIGILMTMLDKKWVWQEKTPYHPSRTYYHISPTGQERLPTAKMIVSGNTMEKEEDERKDQEGNTGRDE